MGYVEKARREKRRLRSKAQLSLRKTSSDEPAREITMGFLPTTPCVVWSRYKERDARFAAGLESSFSPFGETSLVVLTHRCQMLKMEGRLPREPKLQSEPMGG